MTSRSSTTKSPSSSAGATRRASARTGARRTGCVTSCAHAASCSKTPPRARCGAGSGPMTKPDSGVGGEQVEGRRAVHELLHARRRRVRTVYVSSSAAGDPAVAAIVELAGDALRIVPPDRLEKVARTDAPQGVVALAAPLQAASLDELCRAEDAF